MCRARLKAFAGARIHFLNCFSPNTLWFSSSSLLCQAALAKPLASCFMRAVALSPSSLSLSLPLPVSLSKPTLYTFITRAFMAVLVCVCVCIWRLCVYNQRSYSRSLRFYFLFSFFASSFAFARLPFHVSFSCFTFLLFRFFHVQSWQRFKPSAMKFKSAEKCCLHDNKRAVKRGAMLID